LRSYVILEKDGRSIVGRIVSEKTKDVVLKKYKPIACLTVPVIKRVLSHIALNDEERLDLIVVGLTSKPEYWDLIICYLFSEEGTITLKKALKIE